MDDEVIGGFHDDIAPFALDQPDQPDVEGTVDADPDTMYAVPGQALIDIADAIRTKRDTVGAIGVEDMPLEIGLIEGRGNVTVSRGEYTITSASNPVIATLDHAPATPLIMRARLKTAPDTYTNGLAHTMIGYFIGDRVAVYADRSSATAWSASMSGYQLSAYYATRRYISGNKIAITAYTNSNSYTGIWEWEVVEGIPLDF